MDIMLLLLIMITLKNIESKINFLIYLFYNDLFHQTKNVAIQFIALILKIEINLILLMH